MIDLHTHLLPGVDDGAENEAQALALLEAEVEQGVDRLFLTPHFDPRRVSLETFLARREEAFGRLTEAAESASVPTMKLGAEVRFCSEVLEEDLYRLTLGDSNYLLLELPSVTCLTVLEQGVEQMLERGIRPILAHVERYGLFRHQPGALADLIERGALAQVSAGPLWRHKRFSFSHACLARDLAQFVGSDAHHVVSRPPDLDKARAVVSPDRWNRTQAFARAVWNNEETPPTQPRRPVVYLYRHS